MKTLLIIKNAAHIPDWKKFLSDKHSGPVDALLFDEEPYEEIRAALPPDAAVMRASDFMKDSSVRARSKYIKFIAEWPGLANIGGKNFKEAFTHKDRVSLWWFTVVSMKNSLSVPVFNILRHLQVLEDIITGKAYNAAIIIGADPVFAGLARQVCGINKIDHEQCGKAGATGLKTYVMGSVSFTFLSRLKFFIDIAVTKIYITFSDFFAKRDMGEAVAREKIVFCTVYSDTLTYKSGALKDRCYVDLPEFLESKGNYECLYAPYLYGGLFSSLKLYLSVSGKGAGNKIVRMERYIPWRALFGSCFGIKNIFRYLAFERTRSFRGSFNYYGIDIYPLLKGELRRSYIGSCVPRCVLTAVAYENFLKDVEVKGVVSLLELYNVAKAVYFGVKESGSRAITFAYQHGLDTSMNLVYGFDRKEISEGLSVPADYLNVSPMPDYFIFTGEAGKKIISSCGYPESRCLLTGSPRYDRLGAILKDMGHNDNARSPRSSDRKVLLATLSATSADADKMIKNVIGACSGRRDCYVVFKRHPLYDPSTKISAMAAKYGFTDYAIAQKDEDLYGLILSSDAVAVTYSTVGPEAVAMGKRVISFVSPGEADMSIFFELDSPAAIMARTAQELNLALDKVFGQEDIPVSCVNGREAVVRESFFRLDGKAKDRILEEFDRILI